MSAPKEYFPKKEIFQKELYQLFQAIKTGDLKRCIEALEAAKNKNLNIINSILFEAEVNKEEQAFLHLTPLLYAVAIHSPIEIIDLLLQRGADITKSSQHYKFPVTILDICCADTLWVYNIPSNFDRLIKRNNINCELLLYLLKHIESTFNDSYIRLIKRDDSMEGNNMVNHIGNIMVLGGSDPLIKEVIPLYEHLHSRMVKRNDEIYYIPLAIQNADIDTLKQFIHQGYDFNVPVTLEFTGTSIKDRVSLLYYAYMQHEGKKREEVLRVLLGSKGIDVDGFLGKTHDELQHPLIILATKEMNTEIVKMLLQSRADVNRTALDGSTALMVLGSGSFVENPKRIMSLLLSAGADPNKISTQGFTALENAIFQFQLRGSQDWLDCIEMLLRNKADPNFPKLCDTENAGPVSQALKTKNLKLIQLLKSFGGVFDFKAYQDITPLHLSIIENDKKSFEAILETEPGLLNNDSIFGTPLIIAIQSGDIGFVERLLAKSAYINRHSKQTKTTPILEALRSKNEDLIKLLLNAGADLFLKDEQGQSPYSLSVSKKFGDSCSKLLITYNFLGSFDKKDLPVCQRLLDCFSVYKDIINYQPNGDIAIAKDLFKGLDCYYEVFKYRTTVKIMLTQKQRKAIVNELIQETEKSGKLPVNEEIVQIIWKNTSEKKKYDNDLKERKQAKELMELRSEDDAISIRLQMLQHNMNRISQEIEEIKKTKIELISKKDELISILNESNELLSTHNFDLEKKNGQEKKRNTNYDKIKDLDNNYKKFSNFYEAALKSAEKLVEKEQRQKINAIYALRYQQRMTKKAIKGPNKTGEDTLKELEGFCNSFDSNKKAFEAMKLKDTINTAIESSKKTLDLLKENIRMQEATEKKKEADKREEEEQRLMDSIQERDAAMRQAELNIEREKEREAFLKKLKVLKEIRRKELELAAERKRAREEALAKEKKNQEQERLLGEFKDAAEIVSQQPNPNSKPSAKTKIRIRDHVSRLGEFLEAIKSYREENDIINEDLRLVFRDALLLVSAQAMETIKEDMLMIPKKIALLFRNNIYHGQALYKNLDLKEVCEMARLLHEYLLNTNIKSGKNVPKKGERKEEAETRQTNLASRKMFQKLVEDQGLIKDNTFKMIIASVASREKSFEQCKLQIAARDKEFEDRMKLKDRVDKGISEAGILQAAIDFSIARLGPYFRYCHKFYRGQAQYILQNQKWEKMSWYAIIVRHDLQKNAKKEKLMGNFIPGFKAHKAHKAQEAHEAQRRKPSDSERPRKSSSPESRSRGDSTGRERTEVRADRGTDRADRGDYKSSIRCP